MAEYKGIKAVLRQFYVLIKQKLDSIKVDADHFTGTLPVSKGGTGAATAKESEYNLHKDMPNEDSDFGDSSYISGVYQTPSTSQGIFYKRTALHLWNYIKSKISGNDLTTSGTVTATNIKANTRLTIPTSAPSSPQDGDIWIE